MYQEYKLYGPYTGKDGRLRCVLKHKTTKSLKTISFPKYKLECFLNRLIKKGFEVHHKDENPLNNNIENLEEVEKKEHLKNHAIKKIKVWENNIEEKCYQCGNIVFLKDNKARCYYYNKKQGKVGPFCSKICSGIYGKYKQTLGQ